MLLVEKKLEEFQKYVSWESYLQGGISIGVFNSIFTKSGPKTASFNITQTDWELFANAVKSTQIITNAVIHREMQFAYLHYQYPGSYDYKLSMFWKGMLDGCK
jgi:hypothetical protein